MEYPSPSVTGGNLQVRTRPSEPIPQTSPTQSSASEESPFGLRAPPRRSSLPNTRSNRSPPAKINTTQPRNRSTKAASAGPRDKSSHNSLMSSMTGTMSAASEITYTPTTHRISKAKKGKKVHACEFPGCPKIFTRAEHRKRHEANHNTEPAFQCNVEGCRKPFQRADLLARHMERQHNMPVESPLGHGPLPRGAMSETPGADGSPSRPGFVHPSLSQRAGLPSQPMPNSTGTMSIGSIIEPTLQQDYASPAMQSFANYDHLRVPAASRSLPPEMVYGLGATDSPYCSSTSDASCYSPLSDLIQPQVTPHRFHPPDDLPRSQSASIEGSFQPQIYTSPITTTSMPAWNYDHPPLSAPMQSSMVSDERRFHYSAEAMPTYMGANAVSYEMDDPYEWPYRKMTF